MSDQQGRAEIQKGIEPMQAGETPSRGAGFARQMPCPASWLIVLALIWMGATVGAAPLGVQTRAGSESAYTEEEINYFLEIALGAEYGNTEASVKKWVTDIRLAVYGTPTTEDVATLSAVVGEMGDLAPSIEIVLVEDESNIDMYFMPESEFAEYEPNYVPTNYGFFWAWWTGAQEIYRARILIATARITQQERSHLIREELTQSLGLMRDSGRHADSMFYQGWTNTTEYSVLDRAVLEILYRPEVRPGMNRAEAAAVVAGLRVQPTAVAVTSWGMVKWLGLTPTLPPLTVSQRSGGGS